jgi:hypothetical protein
MATPLTWTLRFKYHKTTILLHTDPLTPLSNVKTSLLDALRDTKPDGIESRALPTEPSQIQLAKPVNPLEMVEGWESLDPSPNDDSFDPDEETSRGKQKATKKMEETMSLKAAGVKDNAVIAFRWTLEGDAEEDETLGAREGEWDVVWPSFEDGYHVEVEGDKGIHDMPRDFKD